MTPPSFNLNLLSVLASDGVILPGLLYSNRDRTLSKSKRLLVYVHGAGSSSIVRNVKLFTTMATTCVEDGVDVFCFQNRGAGYITKFDTSSGDSMLGGMTYERIGDFIMDIQGVYTWALQAGYQQIYLAGHSTGANKLALVSDWINRQSRIAKVILIAGGDDITLQRNAFGEENANELQQEALNLIAQDKGDNLVPSHRLAWKHPISWASLRELLTPGSNYDIFPFGRYNAKDPLHFSQVTMLSKPALAIYGMDDFGTVVNPRAALQILKEKNNSIKTALIPDADHNFTGKEQSMIDTILDWIEQ